jgi:hypothetical protein
MERVVLALKSNSLRAVWASLAMILSMSCMPQGQDVRTIARPTAAATLSPRPSPQPPPAIAPQNNQNSTIQGCPAGSESAIPELRTCCRERNWGKSCDGGCWAAGVGEKLRQMCNNSPSETKDCGQSPAKSKVTEWCNFHYNRRYCGISDSEWVKTCTSAP